MGKIKLENHEAHFGLHSKHSGATKSALALICGCKTYNHEPTNTRYMTEHVHDSTQQPWQASIKS
eukprot:1155201-Pelagomonas_calceolata.AAC.1